VNGGGAGVQRVRGDRRRRGRRFRRRWGESRRAGAAPHANRSAASNVEPHDKRRDMRRAIAASRTGALGTHERLQLELR
jgi:hypothetical protein